MFAGQVHDEERRVGVRGDPVGDPEPWQTDPLRALVERGSGAEPATIASGRLRHRHGRGERRMQGEHR